MVEEREVWEALAGPGFLHALRDAHEATTRIVFGRLSRSAGFKERSFGYTSFDVLESQLDRAFQLGGFAPPSPSPTHHPPSTDASLPVGDPLFGTVVRDNLNGSPGWRHGPYRVLLRRHEFGEVDGIRWDQASPTKQAVSKQDYPGDPQLALDIGDLRPPAGDTPGPITLVLAHSASEEPLEMELFIGRPRFNADGGSPWWWRRALTRENLGPDPRRTAAEPTTPIWSDDEADVPLRLHPKDSKADETSTEATR